MSFDSFKPKIVVSSCLGFEATRYDGSMLDNAFVRKLREEKVVEFIQVCPEVAIGLGVPRDTLRIVIKEGIQHLIQPKTELDFTEKMKNYTKDFIKDLSVEGFIFKADSPSVGTDHVKVYQSEKDFRAKRGGAGFFTSQIIEKYPNYPLQSDRRLNNPYIQDSFLTKVYTLTRFRKQVLENNHKNISTFHKNNYFLLLSHNPDMFKQLDKLTHESSVDEEFINKYFQQLREIIKDGANRRNLISSMEEMILQMKPNLSNDLLDLFSRKIEEFNNNYIPKRAILSIMESFAIFVKDKMLINQTIFNPYPLKLVKWEDELQHRFLINAYDIE